MYKSIYHKTTLGKYLIGDFKKVYNKKTIQSIKGKVQLIFTSPPFPLNQKKKYGNLNGEEYKEWFTSLAEMFSELLTDNGSIVIELGNAWEPGRPVQSLLPVESILGFLNNPKAELRLCQNFVCYNPARLPSPAQWVTVNRIRVNDSYTNIWWMAKTDYPKSDNTKILRPYSKSMKKLLKDKKYNAGLRPSEHNISETSFFNNNGGSIMPNVIEVGSFDEVKERRLPHNILRIANTRSGDFFTRECKKRGIQLHPARMPIELASFFIEFLTEPGDLVLDPFAGSNTTGYCAERLGRKWVSVEKNKEYGVQSRVRFEDPELHMDKQRDGGRKNNDTHNNNKKSGVS